MNAVDTEASLQAEITAISKALDLPVLNGLLDEEKWDSVRSVLKVPPVGDAWQQSQAKKNPLRKQLYFGIQYIRIASGRNFAGETSRAKRRRTA